MRKVLAGLRGFAVFITTFAAAGLFTAGLFNAANSMKYDRAEYMTDELYAVTRQCAAIEGRVSLDIEYTARYYGFDIDRRRYDYIYEASSLLFETRKIAVFPK